MKIIGEKLNPQELLQIKGGISCMKCECEHGPGFWLSSEIDVVVAEASGQADCPQGSGDNVSCIWGPHQWCGDVQQQ